MNILVLCTYPIENPSHGGQLRVRNIVDAYRAAGHRVEISGVLGSSEYPKQSGFLDCPNAKLFKQVRELPNSLFMEDFAIGQLYAKNESCFTELSSTIQTKPNIIHIEHPWLFEFAIRFNSSTKLHAKIVYSSHNIEFKLKKQILQSHFEQVDIPQRVRLIQEVETAAIQGADVILAVSKKEVEWFESQTDTPVFLIPNGVNTWSTTAAGKMEASAIIKDYSYALFCASAHPPNRTGFFEMFGGGFGSLKPNEKLIVAGGVGSSIVTDIRVHQSAKLAEKVVNAGFVSKPCLEGLLDAAHCIVLPLTQGGGTNLKTAEALWSGKHIVATSIAMRGFETFIDTHGVTVIDEPSAFKRALRQTMERQPLTLNDQEIKARQSVLWEQSLSSLPKILTNLMEGDL